MTGDEKALAEARSLHAEVMAAPTVPRGRAGLAASAIALVVIVSTAALVPIGVWLVVALPNKVIALLCGGFVLAIAWAVRPRRPSLPDDAVVVDAPRLRSLLDETASAVGTAPPRTVAVVPDLVAAVSQGRRGDGRVLVLGAPLWLALEPQQRVALLAHELAHFVSGDTRRGGLVGGAFQVLDGWRYLLEGDYVDGGTHAAGDGSREGLVTSVASGIAVGVLWVVGLIPLTMGLLLERLTSRDARRAEHRADQIASETAGRDAAVGMLVVVGREAAIDTALQRAALGRQPVLDAVRGLDLAGAGAAVPDEPVRRHDSHPPTAYRVEALRRLAAAPAHVVLDGDRSRAIDDELAPAFDRIERRIRDSYL